MKILLTGRTGQVGHALATALAPLGEVIAPDRAACDLSDPDAITRTVRAVRPGLIVNPAAYTAVDKAQNEQESAFAINARAPAMLARLAAEGGIPLIHYSTDYVFDGAKSVPYTEDDIPNPLSVYGASKRDGEDAIRAALPRHVILRTSWVFGAHGANFLKTMLRLGAERDTLNIVADQTGTPTSADFIARASAIIARRLLAGDAPCGTWHLTAGGATSWHGYAAFLLDAARKRGFSLRVKAVNPITTTDYPTPARRPANSRLDTTRLTRDFAITPPPWQDGVVRVLEQLSKA